MSVFINFLKCLKHKEKAVDFGPGKNQAYFCNKIFSVQGDCPVGALRRIPTKEGKVRLEKNQGRCIRCGMCESKKGGREESHVFDSKEKLVKKTWI